MLACTFMSGACGKPNATSSRANKSLQPTATAVMPRQPQPWLSIKRSAYRIMKYLPLLGKSLKSDELLDMFETHDVEVIYEYDRCHENLPDEYWAKCEGLGTQFAFDEYQVLKSIHIHLTSEDGYTPADLSASDIEFFGAKSEVQSYAEKRGIAAAQGRANFLGQDRDWIKLDYSSHSVHYEFRDRSLSLVTITRK
jgi:hypothetical protein